MRVFKEMSEKLTRNHATGGPSLVLVTLPKVVLLKKILGKLYCIRNIFIDFLLAALLAVTVQVSVSRLFTTPVVLLRSASVRG